MKLIRQLAVLAALMLLGAAIAGVYGIGHDQVTYSIAPEYFTKMKFRQFAWANIGLPPRLFAGQIGFLATWWVGFLAAGMLGAVALFLWPIEAAWRAAMQGFAFVFGGALLAGIVGGVLGWKRRGDPDFGNWQDYSALLGVQDLPAFVHVAYIHNASYLGGLIGLAAGLVFLLAKALRERWRAWKGKR